VLTFDAYTKTEVISMLLRMGLGLAGEFAHADTRYDYDDPDMRTKVLLFVKE
jgi:hypothetical protein